MGEMGPLADDLRNESLRSFDCREREVWRSRVLLRDLVVLIVSDGEETRSSESAVVDLAVEIASARAASSSSMGALSRGSGSATSLTTAVPDFASPLPLVFVDGSAGAPVFFFALSWATYEGQRMSLNEW